MKRIILLLCAVLFTSCADITNEDLQEISKRLDAANAAFSTYVRATK